MRLLVMESILAGSAVATHMPDGNGAAPPQLFLWRKASENFPLRLGLIGKTSVDLVKGMYVDAVNDPDAGNGLKITPVQTPKGMIAFRTPEGALYFKHKDNFPESFDDREVTTYNASTWDPAGPRRVPASEELLLPPHSQKNISASPNLAAEMQARLIKAQAEEQDLKARLEAKSREVMQLHAAIAAIEIIE